MTTERTALWTRRLPAPPRSRRRCAGEAATPGALHFRGWGLEQRLGDDCRALIEACARTSRRARRHCPPKYPYVHGVRDVEKPADLQVHLRGNPMRLGDAVPRGFLIVLSPAERMTFSKGSGRLDWRHTITQQPIAMRVIVNRVWKEHFGTGLVDTPEQLRRQRRTSDHPELLDYLAQFSSITACRSRRCIARSCAAPSISSSADNSRPPSRRTAAIASTGTRTAGA